MTDHAAQIEEDYGIRILRDGTWLYNGTPIGRHNLVRLFASVLKRDDKGDYWLITPVERGRIEVEDAPFIAVAMEKTGAGRDQVLAFRTNVDDTVTLGPDHGLRLAGMGDAENALYIHVRGDRDKGVEAKLARSVYYDLAALAVPQAGLLGVWSGGRFFPIGDAP